MENQLSNFRFNTPQDSLSNDIATSTHTTTPSTTPGFEQKQIQKDADRIASGERTIEEFAKSIKEKYPTYQDKDNYELVSRIIAKYPTYKKRIEIPNFAERAKLSFGDADAQKKRILIDSIESGASLGDIADVMGPSLPLGGMLAGGIAGTVASPGAGSIAGAGAGSGLGELMKQYIGKQLGVQEKYEPKEIAKEAAYGLTAEVGGKLIGGALKTNVAQKVIHSQIATPLFQKFSQLSTREISLISQFSRDKGFKKWSANLGKGSEFAETSALAKKLKLWTATKGAFSAGAKEFSGDVTALLGLGKGATKGGMLNATQRMLPYIVNFIAPATPLIPIKILMGTLRNKPLTAYMFHKILSSKATINNVSKVLSESNITPAFQRIVIVGMLEEIFNEEETKENKEE